MHEPECNQLCVKACLEKSCDQLIACFQTIPDCQGGTSSGGTGGSGGSTGGSGGSGGSTAPVGRLRRRRGRHVRRSSRVLQREHKRAGQDAVPGRLQAAVRSMQGDAACGMVLSGNQILRLSLSIGFGRGLRSAGPHGPQPLAIRR